MTLSQPSYGQAPKPVVSNRKGWLRLIVAIGVLALAVAATLIIRNVATNPLGGTVPSKDLPAQRPVPNPQVVEELQAHGLTCMDEVAEAWMIKGCYEIAAGRIVSIRMKVIDDAVIEKFQVNVLDGTVTESERLAEFTKLTELMFAAAKVGAADQQLIADAVAQQAVHEFEPIEWGELYLPEPGRDSLVVTLTRPGIAPIGHKLLAESSAAFLGELRNRDYTCEVTDESSFECTNEVPGAEISGALHEGGILTLSIWWEGTTIPPEHPTMIDVYAALAAESTADSEAIAHGLVKMCDETPERLYVNGFRVMRWESNYSVESVDFV